MYSKIGSCGLGGAAPALCTLRLTFWPRFSVSNTDTANRLKFEAISTLRPAAGTELATALAVTVKLSGEAIFPKLCQDA